MEKHRAIPAGYIKVGELAKKAGVTVRTLQYYDKEGLLSPSAESEGGFRLYADKDIAKLAQILMMRQLGFTLADIKKRLTSMDTPSDVINVLTEHATQIRDKVKQLSESLDEIEALKAEIAQTEVVNFKKFTAILFALQMKNKHYKLIKHLDDDVFDKLEKSMNREKAEAFTETTNRLFDEAIKLKNENAVPESEKGQAIAKIFWGKMMEIVDGDIDLLHKLNEINHSDKNWDENYIMAQGFIESALMFYFNNQPGALEGDRQDD